MLVPGIVGLRSLLLVFVLVAFLLIRRKWRNAVAKKEEIMRLVAMASEEAAMAEVEATSVYDSVLPPRPFQCVICYCPTTMRCSQCKAVRYCSGKCQIIHWRRGHKDECQPPIATMQFEERSDFSGELESQYSNDFEIENESRASSLMDDDAKVKPCTDGKGKHTDFASLYARSESLVDISSKGSGTSDNSRRPLPDGISPDFLGNMASINEMAVTLSPPKECTKLDKFKKMEPSQSDEKIKSTSQFMRAKTVKSGDAHFANLGSKKPSKATGPAEKVATDSAKPRNSSSSDGRDNIRLFESKERRSFSSSASGDSSSSTTGGHFVSSSKSAKSDGYHALPAKLGSSTSLTQSGLKTSVRKVVQQFRASKHLKSNISGHENEIAGRYKVIFPYELFIELFSHDKMVLCPFGLTNCGNSCYANAVLQCLAFTQPITSYLLQGLHSKTCRKKGWCFICEFEYLILKAREGKSPLSPIRILSKIHKIGGHLGHGREEDAHEFLRYAVDTMQSVFLDEAGAEGPLAEETTLVGMTFGGYLRSKIKCMKCLGKSERCEQMMDLTVEIDGEIRTLEEALAQFTATETLDRDNKYYCSRCKSYEKAKKKLMVLEAPNILTIVLKRFQSGNFEKLSKSVQFPEILNMVPYMSGSSDKSAVYSLYAVVVHLDIMNATFSGHYVCYVKNIQGEWFKIDDSTVEPVELERVLSEGAYMLLYARRSPRPPSLLGSSVAPHGGKLKKRSLEAVPSSHAKPKSRSNSAVPSIDSSAQQKFSKNSYLTTLDGPAVHPSLDPYDWRLNSMHRVPIVDSSSESSSLFSSDASSCSTVSTKDSASTDDFTDYIFGEAGTNWKSMSHIEKSSCGETDLDQVLWSNPLDVSFRLSGSIFATAAARRAMVTSSSSSSNASGGSYTTIKESVRFEKEIKKSKFIAIAGPISDEQSAFSFLSQVKVREPRATHNCWAYKVGDQFRSNDDGEPSGTAGKPIHSAIVSSGIDRVMVVVIRYFGGIKLGTGGLVRTYGGVASECLRNAPTFLVKSKVRMGVEVPFDLLGVLYHQLQSFQVEDIKQDYETGKDGIAMITFKAEFDRVDKLEEAIKDNCSRDLVANLKVVRHYLIVLQLLCSWILLKEWWAVEGGLPWEGWAKLGLTKMGLGDGSNIGLGRDGFVGEAGSLVKGVEGRDGIVDLGSIGSEGNGGIMVLGRDGILGNGNAGGEAAVAGVSKRWRAAKLLSLDDGGGERRAVGGVGIFILDGILVGTEVVSGCCRNGIFGNGNGRNGILGNLNFGNLSFGNLSFGNEKVGSLMGKVGAEANIGCTAIAGRGASATRSAVSERRRPATSRLLPLVLEDTDNSTSSMDRTRNKLLGMAMDEVRKMKLRKISFCLSVVVEIAKHEGDGERRAVGGVGIFILDGILVGTEVVSGCGRNGIFGNGNGRNGILGNLNFGNLSFGNLSFGNEKVGSLMGKVGTEANNGGIAIAGCGASANRSAVSERWR
ncbi:hypothetical protein FNV43_RR17492 [Rhamnella rubrinervis]|uniref:ubiquitinyl hydrolase 1 n=1 Tax=Rhamnella rubrinervis TaxID=2594499 RepID=A0A8K0DX72_9ROSA|nr:hypothetical protein FNV43_RR17492 [Rhamnella rubrinervis]